MLQFGILYFVSIQVQLFSQLQLNARISSWTLAVVAQQDTILMVLEDVYKFKPHVNASDQKIAAMAILGLIITNR